jgi:hypothetical protein
MAHTAPEGYASNYSANPRPDPVRLRYLDTAANGGSAVSRRTINGHGPRNGSAQRRPGPSTESIPRSSSARSEDRRSLTRNMAPRKRGALRERCAQADQANEPFRQRRRHMSSREPSGGQRLFSVFQPCSFQGQSFEHTLLQPVTASAFPRGGRASQEKGNVFKSLRQQGVKQIGRSSGKTGPKARSAGPGRHPWAAKGGSPRDPCRRAAKAAARLAASPGR